MLFNSYEFLFAFLPVVLAGLVEHPPAARPPRVPHGVVLCLLRLVGLAVPAAHARLDDGRLRRRARADRARRRRAAPAGRPGRCAHASNLGAARLLQVRRLLRRLARRDRQHRSALGAPFPEPATSSCRSASRSTRSTRCRTRSTSSAGEVQPARSLLHYAAFVSMFPHLIAGPIVRYSTIDGQLRTPDAAAHVRSSPPRASSSSRCGLVKKLADRRRARAARRPPLRTPRPPRGGRRLGGGRRVRAPALLRLLGLLRHGGRARVPARLPVPAELQLAVQVA